MNSTLSVAVLSGKGGVGKTNLSLNLACALYQAGFKNLLMDCDMGLANLDVLLGITPEGNLQDALLGDARLSDVLYPLEPKGFDVLPAASGVPELNDMRPDLRDMLLERLEPVLGKYDYIFMDLGAGHFRNSADLRGHGRHAHRHHHARTHISHGQLCADQGAQQPLRHARLHGAGQSG